MQAARGSGRECGNVVLEKLASDDEKCERKGCQTADTGQSPANNCLEFSSPDVSCGANRKPA
jgi:hypothetical protein